MVSATTFNEEDRAYIREWIRKNAPEGIPTKEWAAVVVAALPRAEVVEEEGSANIYLPHP